MSAPVGLALARRKAATADVTVPLSTEPGELVVLRPPPASSDATWAWLRHASLASAGVQALLAFAVAVGPTGVALPLSLEFPGWEPALRGSECTGAASPCLVAPVYRSASSLAPGPLSAAALAIAALLTGLPARNRGAYTLLVLSRLRLGLRPWRWCEQALTAPLLAVAAVAGAGGGEVLHLGALALMVTLTHLMGLLQDYVAHLQAAAGQGATLDRWTPHACAWLAHAAAWGPALVRMLLAQQEAPHVPLGVALLVVSQALFGAGALVVQAVAAFTAWSPAREEAVAITVALLCRGLAVYALLVTGSFRAGALRMDAHASAPPIRK